jgi:hypothetical protein
MIEEQRKKLGDYEAGDWVLDIGDGEVKGGRGDGWITPAGAWRRGTPSR